MIEHTADVIVGVDVGGTKIAVLVTSTDGDLLGRSVRPSMADGSQAVAAIAATVEAALADAGRTLDDVVIVGVGVPGRVDPDRGRVTLAVNLGWTDVDLRAPLEERLGRPCVLENDARAAAFAIHRRATVGGADDLAYLAVGTGVAAGLVLGGDLHRGARGLAGEIGHVVVDPDGPICACGQRGCLETFVSGPGIARRAAAEIARGAVTTMPGPEPSAPQVFAAAREGDAVAGAIVRDVGRRLAWTVHLLVLAYDVGRVVIGGGVSHAGEAFAAPLRHELERLRDVAGPARDLLPPDVLHVLPVDADPGAWGAVTIAAAARDRWRPNLPG